MVDRNFERANAESRQRLARLVASLTPEQLGADLGEGWTVASVLAHMGYRDRFHAGRLERLIDGKWSADGTSVAIAELVANEALHPYWGGITMPGLAELAMEAAARVDGLIESAPDELIESLEGTPSARAIHRHHHRDEHLDQIERGLAGSAPDQPIDRGYLTRNEESRRRLERVLRRMSAADLDRPVGDGTWTVGQVLGHLSFWDRFLAARWRAALAAGPTPRPVDLPKVVTDLLNDALVPGWGAMVLAGIEAVVAETLAAAAEANSIIAALPADAPVGAILAIRPPLLDRSIHRLEHVAALEAALEG